MRFSKSLLADRKLRLVLRHLPLRDLDRLLTGRHVRYYQEWLASTASDDYWGNRGFADTLSQVTTPVSIMAGWQDPFLPAQLRDYAALSQAGHQPRLTIGPWGHADDEAIAVGIADSLAWLRSQLLGDTSPMMPDPVRIFVTGAEEWRGLPAWPPEVTWCRWYLDTPGQLTPAPPTQAGVSRYTYDPADPTPDVVRSRGKAMTDCRDLESRPDLITYTSDPFDQDLEVIGEVSVDLVIASSLEHTDFLARLCDVHPDGRSEKVCDALTRLLPGQPITAPDGTRRVRIDLWPTAHRFRRGHRLRLQVSSGAHPRYARNLGSGEPLGSATRLCIAEQRVYHGPDRLSVVTLPVAR